jgi:hypothetical protein
VMVSRPPMTTLGIGWTAQAAAGTLAAAAVKAIRRRKRDVDVDMP